MERSDRPLGFHSPRGEWGRQVETDRPLGFHSLTGRVGLIEDGIRSTTLLTLSKGRVGSRMGSDQPLCQLVQLRM
jgi:hypothetical protein